MGKKAFFFSFPKIIISVQSGDARKKTGRKARGCKALVFPLVARIIIG